MRNWLRGLRPIIPLLAGVFIVFGEHIWRAEPARPYLSGLAVLLLTTALVWNVVATLRMEKASASHRTSALSPVWPAALFGVAAMLYFGGLALPATAGRDGPDWTAILSWGWALALVMGAVLYVFIEAALLSQSNAARWESRRLRMARNAGLSLGLLLVLIVTLNFVGARLPWQWDLGYFKTTQPSEATRQLVANLDAPVALALFFPNDNAVQSVLHDYFLLLQGQSPYLEIAYYDAELHPREAREFKGRKNGIISFKRDDSVETINMGLDLQKARSDLAQFDHTFFTKLLKVTREKRTAYLTVGHGERNETDTEIPKSSRVKGLEKLLKALNYKVKSLGLSQGLGSDVPDDAGLVLVIGPEAPFQQVEIDALQRYLDRGGRLMIFLEPRPAGQGRVPDSDQERSPRLQALLAGYGLIYSPVVHANDRIFGRRTHTKADHALLATARYMSHPSVAKLRRTANQLPLLFLVSGAWSKSRPQPNVRVRETIKGMPGSWSDKNGNFEFDRDSEQRIEPILVAAIAPKSSGDADDDEEDNPEMRILAFADADVASDLFIQNRANQLALIEGISWLAVEEQPAGLPEKGEDLKMQHVKGDELVWFYLPVFAVPLLILLAGGVLTRLRGQAPRRSGDA